MSRDPRLRIRCPETGKTCFGSRASAESALRTAWKHPKGPVTPTRTYECPECGWWHMTASWNPEGRTRRRPDLV